MYQARHRLSTYLLISSLFHGILDNVKALYRRARAHVGAWNPEQAKNDFKKVAELDSGTSSLHVFTNSVTTNIRKKNQEI